MNELELNVIVVIAVDCKHLDHLHKEMGARQQYKNNAQCQPPSKEAWLARSPMLVPLSC
jgi:hypothetical protein